jgi:hypothetical protein
VGLGDHCSCCKLSTPPPPYPISATEVEQGERSLKTPEIISTLADTEVEERKGALETPETSLTPTEPKVEQCERPHEAPEISSTQAEEEKDKYSSILERSVKVMKEREEIYKTGWRGGIPRESVEIERKYYARTVAMVEKWRRRDEEKKDKYSRILECSQKKLKEREEKYKRGPTSQESVEIERKYHARMVALVEKWGQRDEKRGLAQAKRHALNQDRSRYRLDCLEYHRKWRDFVVANQDGTWRKRSMRARLAISWHLQHCFGFKIPLTGEIWNGHVGFRGDYQAARKNNAHESCEMYPTQICSGAGYYDKKGKQWKCFQVCSGVEYWPCCRTSEGVIWGRA